MIVYFSEIHLSAGKCPCKLYLSASRKFEVGQVGHMYSAPVITLHPEKQTLINGSKVLANLSLRIFVVLLNYHNFNVRKLRDRNFTTCPKLGTKDKLFLQKIIGVQKLRVSEYLGIYGT